MKRNFSKVVVLLLVLVLAIVPVFALAAFAEGETVTVTFDVPLGVDDVESITTTAGTQIELPAANNFTSNGVDYTFVGWTTAPYDKEEESGVCDSTLTVNENTKLYAVYSYTVVGSAGSTTYELFSGNLEEGNYVIVYGTYAMKATVSSNRLGYETVTKNGNQVVDPGDTIIWTIAKSGDYWTIYNKSVGKYAASNGTKNQAQLLAFGTDDKSLWTASGTSTYEFVNKNNAANGVNANLRNNGTYGFAPYSTSTGGALSLYKETVTAGGDVTYYSTMTSYTATFVNNGVVCKSEKGCASFPELSGVGVYAFAGWTTDALTEDTNEEPDIFESNSKISITEDTIFYAVYTYTKVESGVPVTTITEKTDLSGIADGSVVIITTTKNGSTYAMNHDSLNTKKAPNATKVTAADMLKGNASDSLKWVITSTEKGYIFKNYSNTTQYLYSTADNNGLRIGTTATSNANVFKITSSYLQNVATNRYIGVYNNTDWRSYTSINSNISGQTYKYYVETTTAGGEQEVTYYTCNSPVSFESVSVTIGSDLSINYIVKSVDGVNLADYNMNFTFNGEVVEGVNGVSNAGKYIYTFSGITPEKMGDNIEAKLINGDGDCVFFLSEYSVKENLIKVRDEVPETTEAEKKLINATLGYGAAAQQYRDYNTDNLVAEIPDDLAGPGDANVRDKTNSTVEGLNFTAAGVNFDYCNRIYARFENTNNAENVSAKVTIDGVECVFETFVNNGITTIYSDALKATQLGSAVVFQIYQGETLVQQLTYSAYDYVYGMQGTENTALKNLIFALYQYGKAAEACN